MMPRKFTMETLSTRSTEMVAVLNLILNTYCNTQGKLVNLKMFMSMRLLKMKKEVIPQNEETL
jgi:hypothetical protein